MLRQVFRRDVPDDGNVRVNSGQRVFTPVENLTAAVIPQGTQNGAQLVRVSLIVNEYRRELSFLEEQALVALAHSLNQPLARRQPALIALERPYFINARQDIFDVRQRRTFCG